MKQLTDYIKEALKISKSSNVDKLINNSGAYACFKDLSLSDDEDYIKEHRKDAIGVAIIHKLDTDEFHRFVISKNDLGQYYFGGYKIDLSNCGATLVNRNNEALIDLNGKENTNAIYNALKGKKDECGIESSPIIEACMSAFNKYGFKEQGYLPAEGEYQILYEYKRKINKILKLINGDTLKKDIYWSSTIFDSYNSMWIFDFYDAYIGRSERLGNDIHCCRACMELK